MTTYAPNWTPRYKASYRVVGLTHSITLRAPRGSDVATVTALATVAHDLFDAMSAHLASDFTWLDAAYALTDSDVFVPTSTPAAVTGALDPGDFAIMNRISPLIFSGRSATGRARVSTYGVSYGNVGESGSPLDFQITDTEQPTVGDAIDVLQAGAIGNAGEVTTWHRKVTQKPNDRLVKKVRQGII